MLCSPIVTYYNNSLILIHCQVELTVLQEQTRILVGPFHYHLLTVSSPSVNNTAHVLVSQVPGPTQRLDFSTVDRIHLRRLCQDEDLHTTSPHVGDVYRNHSRADPRAESHK